MAEHQVEEAEHQVEEAGLPWVGDGHVDERNQVVHQEQEQVVPAVTILLFEDRADNEKCLREKKKERERESEERYLLMVDIGT